MAEVLKTAKLDLKKSIVSSSVFSAASSNIASSISPMIPFGGVAKAIGSQPAFLDSPKLDKPKENPFADIVAQLQVKFESLSSSVRANYRDIKSLKKFVKSEKKEKDNSLEETNQILEDIGQALALDFANRVTEKKEKLDLLKDSILKKRVEDEEQELEKGTKNTKETNKKLDKVIAPAKGIFSSILEFFALLGTAILAKTAFTWLEDPKNREKLAGIFTWLTEHWKWIVGGLAIGGLVLALAPLVGLFGVIAGILSTIGTIVTAFAPFALPILAIAGAAAIFNMFGGSQTARNVSEAVETGRKAIVAEGGEPLSTGELILGLPTDVGGPIWKMQQQILDPTGIPGVDFKYYNNQFKTGGYTGEDGGIVHPHEFVIKKDVVDMFGIEPFERINSLKKSDKSLYSTFTGMNPTINISNSVNNNGGIVDRYQEFMIKVKEELKIIEKGIRDEFTSLLQKFHGGGTVIGEPGIDKITVKLTHGEEVINKDSADKFRYVLKDINDNSGEMWLAFQEGVKIQSEINKDNKKLISNLAATLNVLQKQTNNLVEYESNNKSLENTLLPNTFLSSSKKEENGGGDKNWIQKFWEWFVPPAEKSNEPSVRAGVRTPQTGFSHVESMSGGTQLFGSPSTKNLKRQRTNVQVVNQTNVGDGVSVDTGNGNNTGVVPAKQRSTGKDIQIFPYDVNNSWILEAVYAYEIASPVGSVVGPQE